MNKTNKIKKLIYEMLSENSLSELMTDTLACLRAGYMIYTNAHWQCKGQGYYGNHLMMQRLYEEVQPLIDGFAEQMIGSFGNESVSLSGQQMFKINQIIESIESQELDPLLQSIMINKTITENLNKLYHFMKRIGKMTLGWDDLIMATSQKNDTHYYLLSQALGSGQINEYWSQHTEKYMTNKKPKFNNNEKGEKTRDIYSSANDGRLSTSRATFGRDSAVMGRGNQIGGGRM